MLPRALPSGSLSADPADSEHPEALEARLRPNVGVGLVGTPNDAVTAVAINHHDAHLAGCVRSFRLDNEHHPKGPPSCPSPR